MIFKQACLYNMLEKREYILRYAAQIGQGGMMAQAPQTGLTTPPRGTWVQTQREAHEAWARLFRQSPRAAELLHLLVARVGRHNAVVISQTTLAKLMGRSRDTVKRAVTELRASRFIEVRQIGDRGTTNAYIINDQVAWQGKRDGIRYSLFSAQVIVSENEQPDDIDEQPDLRKIPALYPGEQQLPTGDGLPPPSEPEFSGFEPDLPARHHDPETGKRRDSQTDIEDFTQ